MLRVFEPPLGRTHLCNAVRTESSIIQSESFPDYKHLLQENYVEYKHLFFKM
jgi:hypothetical protein